MLLPRIDPKVESWSHCGYPIDNGVIKIHILFQFVIDMGEHKVDTFRYLMVEPLFVCNITTNGTRFEKSILYSEIQYGAVLNFQNKYV
jgi:hypothetical protein